ncbi:MAG: SGNH/GDSL hydrolase family protein [Parasporobacterium sp.]|nr:SGNH/GDSL hydrolase family protein [Parasporobacterium sp.]
MKKKLIGIILITVIVAAGLLWLVQGLLMPKFMSEIPEGAMIQEYYENAGGNDVIFISDCEVYENFSPITLWEDYGITSYIRGSAQQLIWQSYYLMEETFRYETPKIMVFNVLEMKYDTPQSTGASSQREAYNRMTLDGMKWSSSKVSSIYASMTQEEREKDGIWSYLFPILRYHDRWSEISGEDFRYLFQRDKVTDNGYLMQVKVNPVGDDYPVIPLVNYQFGENSYYYLDKMVELCKEHGTQLVLIKAPTLSPIWYDEWDQQMVDYAKEHDLLYINFLDRIDEIGIDWNTDTYDQGLHLNVYGAEKLSRYFGRILSEELGVEDHRTDARVVPRWTQKCETYMNRKETLEKELQAVVE